MIKAIIFDLGNVLISFDHRIAAAGISRYSDKNESEIFNLFFDSTLTAAFEKGEISSLDFFSQVQKTLNLKIGFQEFLAIWNNIFFLTEENRAVYELARDLKKKYTLLLLSNINQAHFAYIKRTFPVLDAFHHVITSYELGLRKPDPLIYGKILEMLGISGGEAFYTDDRVELVESALRLGLRAFPFRGIKQLESDLAGSGVRIN